MAEFASNGKANAALATGIIGTSGVGLSLLNGMGGILGGLGGNNAYINRYEMELQKELSAKDSRIGLLESNIYTDAKIADVYERLNTKIGCLEKEQADQRVYNATLNGAVSCIQGQIAQLMSLTKLVVPNTAVCPGWGNVTVAPETTTA